MCLQGRQHFSFRQNLSKKNNALRTLYYYCKFLELEMILEIKNL